jgi:hypothetical protein
MKYYHLQVFCGGIPVSISAVKNERIFFQTISKLLSDTLVGAMFTMRLHDEGIIVESGNITNKFLGSTIPFVYQNRKLELRVYPETLS